jgi:hypothetical protein
VSWQWRGRCSGSMGSSEAGTSGRLATALQTRTVQVKWTLAFIPSQLCATVLQYWFRVANTVIYFCPALPTAFVSGCLCIFLLCVSRASVPSASQYPWGPRG